MTTSLASMDKKLIRATALSCVQPGWQLRVQMKLDKVAEGKPSNFILLKVITAGSEHIAGDIHSKTDDKGPTGHVSVPIEDIHAVAIVGGVR